MPATELQRLSYCVKFSNLYNKDFQTWIEEICTELHSPGDFQAIRNTSGDGGLDGFAINSQHVYAIHAPSHDDERSDGKTARKMRSDFAAASTTLHENLKMWSFVHNHADAKLGKLGAAAISDLKLANPDITFEILSRDSLWRKLTELPAESINRLFPDAEVAVWNPQDHYERPPATGPCFGRESEISAYVSNCCSDNPQPAIVLGAPGIGKSAVARAVLNDYNIVNRFGWRRFWIDCETIRDHSSLVVEAARVVGLEHGPDREPALMYQLSQSPACLVLDNLETPLNGDYPGVCNLISRFAGVSGLSLIATRRGDGCPGELDWFTVNTLRPLAMESARDAFCAIAGQSLRNDPLRDKLLNAVERVPLAVALLAHQSRGYADLKRVWTRWNTQKAKMLRREAGQGRLNSLAVSIELSIEVVNAKAVRLLALLALLPSGCDELDMVNIAGLDAIESSEMLQHAGLAERRGVRLYSLAPIREYVAQSHPAPEAIIWRLASFYCGVMVEFGAGLGEAGGRDAAARIAGEYGNLTALLNRAPTSAATGRIELLAIALGQFTCFTGIGGPDVIEQLLDVASRLNNTMAMAVCTHALGDIAIVRSNHEDMHRHFARSIELYRQCGEQLGVADCLSTMGRVLMARSDYSGAVKLFSEALGEYDKLGNDQGQAHCAFNLGRIALLEYDNKTARERIGLALDTYRIIHDLLGEANCLACFGDLEHRECNYREATTLNQSALDLYSQVGDLSSLANCKLQLGKNALACLNIEQANINTTEAMECYKQLRSPLGIANCLLSLGDIAIHGSDYHSSELQYEDALKLFRQIDHALGEANSIMGLAKLKLLREDYNGSEACSEQAALLFRQIGDILGEGNCAMTLGDVALARLDVASAAEHYESAIELYVRARTPLSIGRVHVKLARMMSQDLAARALHAKAALDLWRPIDLDDLVAGLVEEFPELASP